MTRLTFIEATGPSHPPTQGGSFAAQYFAGCGAVKLLNRAAVNPSFGEVKGFSA